MDQGTQVSSASAVEYQMDMLLVVLVLVPIVYGIFLWVLFGCSAVATHTCNVFDDSDLSDDEMCDIISGDDDDSDAPSNKGSSDKKPLSPTENETKDTAAITSCWSRILQHTSVPPTVKTAIKTAIENSLMTDLKNMDQQAPDAKSPQELVLTLEAYLKLVDIEKTPLTTSQETKASACDAPCIDSTECCSYIPSDTDDESDEDDPTYNPTADVTTLDTNDRLWEETHDPEEAQDSAESSSDSDENDEIDAYCSRRPGIRSAVATTQETQTTTTTTTTHRA